jgi:hypothetical protein
MVIFAFAVKADAASLAECFPEKNNEDCRRPLKGGFCRFVRQVLERGSGIAGMFS